MNIKEKIEYCKDDIIRDIAGLIKIKSYKSEPLEGMPFGKNCADALSEALRIADSLGFETVNLDNYAGYAQMGDGEDIIGILCHVDVVPEGLGWSHEPYELSVESDKLYGRGVCDDKGPLVAALYAMKIAREISPEMKKRVRLVIGANEESGFECVKHYKKLEGGFTMGFSPDADFPLIFGEKGNYHADISAPLNADSENKLINWISAGTVRNAVPAFCECMVTDKISATGVMDKFFSFLTAHNLSGDLQPVPGGLSLKIAGKAAHASTPELGVNAAAYMVKFLGEIVYDSPFVNAFNKLIALDTKGSLMGVACSDKYGDLTMNAGVVSTNADGVCTVTLDIRYPVTVDFSPYEERMSQKIKEAGADEKFVSTSLPLLVDPESPLVKNLLEAYREVTHDYESRPLVIGGGTYARAFENVVAFGPEFEGDDSRLHDNDENLIIQRLYTAVEIYVKAILKLLAL